MSRRCTYFVKRHAALHFSYRYLSKRYSFPKISETGTPYRFFVVLVQPRNHRCGSVLTSLGLLSAV
jgi:hypothetical protein